MSLCDSCVVDKSLCVKCRDNPIYSDYPKRSMFKAYIPVCPRGYEDCVYDPAYIKCEHPEWYEELYGELSPEEAIYVEDGCYERVKNDPDEYRFCYDYEDK